MATAAGAKLLALLAAIAPAAHGAPGAQPLRYPNLSAIIPPGRMAVVST